MGHNVEGLARTLDAEIPEAMERLGIPGMAVGICDAAGTLWSAGYGTTLRDGGTPITPATTFSVQSSSKVFTATVVLRAVQQSLVTLDAPITEYLPDFSVNSVFEPAPGAAITLRHCLSHTAGFTHEAPLGSNYDAGNGDFESHCRSIFATWLRFPVGHHFEYSNLGIDLAGYVLQRVSGLSFAEYARRELFEPLDLARTTFDPAAIEAEPDRAVGHWHPFERAGHPLPVVLPMVAAGGLYTTTADALRFLQLCLREGAGLLAPGLFDELRRVAFPVNGQELGYGLGVYIDEWSGGVRVQHHGGSGGGFQSQMLWSPDLGIGAVILVNSYDHPLPDHLARQIVGHVTAATGRGNSAVAPAAVAKRRHDDPLGKVDDLLGEYVGRLGRPTVVAVDAGRLLVRAAENHPAHVLAPRTIGLDSSQCQRYHFLEGPDGTIAYMVSLRDGETRYRNDPSHTPPSQLDPGDEGIYDVLVYGVPAGSYRLVQDGDCPLIVRVADAYGDGWEADDGSEAQLALALKPIGPRLFLSSTGEVLDLRSTPPTYANIPLVRVGPGEDTS